MLLYAPVVRHDDLAAQHRLPDPPARREHLARELPARAVHAAARARPSGATSASALRGGGGGDRHACRAASRRTPGPRRCRSRRSTARSAVRELPDTDCTQRGEPGVDRRGAGRRATCVPSRAAGRARSTRSTPSWPRAVAARRRVGGDAVRRAARGAVARWPTRWRRERGRDAGADGAHRVQDRRRGRPGGVRGDRLRSLLRAGARTRIEQRVGDGLDVRRRTVSCWWPSPWNFPYAIPAGGVLRRARRRQRGDAEAGARGARGRRSSWSQQLWRAGVPRDLRAVRRLPRRRGRPATRHPRRRRHGRAHRRVRDGAAVPLVEADASGCWPRRAARTRWSITAAADDDAGDPRPRALGVRPRRPEVLGGQPGDRRGVGVRRPVVPCAGSPTRCAACASARPTDLATMIGPLIGAPSPKLLRALTDARAGGGVAGRAAAPRRRRRTCGRPGVRVGVQPGSWFHLTECFGPVLGRDARRRPRPRDRAAERRGSSGSPAASTRSTSTRSRTGSTASRSATPTSTATSPARSCSASRSAGGSGRRSAAARRRAARSTWRRSAPGLPARPIGRRMGARGRVPRRVARLLHAWSTTRPGLACERNVLRYRPLPSVGLYVAPDADPAPSRSPNWPLVSRAYLASRGQPRDTDGGSGACDRVAHRRSSWPRVTRSGSRWISRNRSPTRWWNCAGGCGSRRSAGPATVTADCWTDAAHSEAG